VRRGHRVVILTTNAQSALPWLRDAEFRDRMLSDPQFSGSELFIARGYGRTGLLSRYTWTPGGKRWLGRRLRDPQNRPEIIHIHGVFSHLTTFTPRLARRFRVPYILRPAGTFSPKCLKMGRHRLKRWFTRIFVSKDLHCAAAVHATTPAEAEELKQQFGLQNVVTIPHGVPVPNLAMSAHEARSWLGIPTEAIVLLYLSRIAPKKRIDWVVEAVARLRADFPNLFCVVAGPEAGAGQTLEAAIQRTNLNGHIKRFGFVQGAQKEQLLCAADLFVLPSESENFGVAVVEAMAYGVPVVVTPGVASHVYVDAAGCGFTVEDSVEAVAEGIRRVLKSDRAELGRRGQEYVKRHLTWSVVVDKLDELYQHILQR
jgi:glycosyltransferase involved in cell wall biosynthesis